MHDALTGCTVDPFNRVVLQRGWYLLVQSVQSPGKGPIGWL